jgi:hypothetical protein
MIYMEIIHHAQAYGSAQGQAFFLGMGKPQINSLLRFRIFLHDAPWIDLMGSNGHARHSFARRLHRSDPPGTRKAGSATQADRSIIIIKHRRDA